MNVIHPYSVFDQTRRTLRLCSDVGLKAGIEAQFLFPKVMPFTMVSRKRLEALFRLATLVNQEGIAGDFVECGTCNGGTAALLGATMLKSSLPRRLWLFDSFEGLPSTSAKDGVRARTFVGKCRGDVDTVKQILGRAAVPLERVKIVKGWFQETFLRTPISQVALLHCDADWYDSVKLTLTHFYDLVAPGGYVVFDDYGFWEGCRAAVDEFVAERKIPATLTVIDTRAVFLQKPR
jgi:O-methyltransferase